MDASYNETIQYLFGLQRHGIKLGLANSAAIMRLLGDPHRRFRSVHVAGTNGKGSTAAFISSVLEAVGLRTGLYTSPHLVSFTERIRINGVHVAEERVVELAKRVRDAYRNVTSAEGREPIEPTFFEVATAMAFAHFAEEGVDIAVIEVGMGGRLDSTNIITPLVSLITNIDIEHAEFLGGTLELIAAEKAGIIKEGVPVVTGASQPGVISVIEKTAAKRQATLFRYEKDFVSQNVLSGVPQVFDYQGMKSVYKSLAIRMLGRHQIANACLAVAGIECIRMAGIPIDETALRRGLLTAAWEGRLERVSVRPDIYLDGAHNPAAGRTLAAAVREMKRSYGRIILVLGILADKDYQGIVSELAPLADSVIVTKPQYSRALGIHALESEVRRFQKSVSTADTVRQAISTARDIASDDDLIIITGSLYVVGDARAVLAPDAAGTTALSGLKG